VRYLGEHRGILLGVLAGLALLAWIGVDLVPEWVPGSSRLAWGQARLHERLGYEQRYGAGWLTTYYRAHGALPDAMPTNRAAAGNGVVIQRCPIQPEDLVSVEADWALCEEQRAVYALARHRDLVQGVGVPEKVELFPR
jgi:hypothetical protein